MSICTKPPAPVEKITIDDVTCEVTDSPTVVGTHRDLPWHRGQWSEPSWFRGSNLDSDGVRFELQFQIQTADGGRKQPVRAPVTTAESFSRTSSRLS
jgi:hypothetical protein